MYIRQRTPIFMLGWFFVALGFMLMLTREGRAEVMTILTVALDAQRAPAVLDIQSALEKEKSYVAE